MKSIAIDEKIFKKHRVKLAYLFGSRVKSNAAAQSDFDVAVLFEESDNYPDFFDKTVYLKEDIKEYFLSEVDVTALNEADSILKYEVISHGQLLYAEDERFRLDYEVLSINQYFDDKYTRDIYYQALKERVAKGAF